jgi:hypothetical protein
MHTIMQERDVSSFLRGDQCAAREFRVGQGFTVYMFNSANVDARYSCGYMSLAMCVAVAAALGCTLSSCDCRTCLYAYHSEATYVVAHFNVRNQTEDIFMLLVSQLQLRRILVMTLVFLICLSNCKIMLCLSLSLT